MNNSGDNSKMKINWVEKTVPIATLKPYEKNPRRITKDAYDKLKASIIETGYHSRIKVTPDMRVVGGHVRIRALKELGVKEVPVLVPDRALTDTEFRRVLIQDNLMFGEFDLDILANDFNIEELLEWGFPEKLLPMDFEPGTLEDQGDLTEKATKEVTCPECGHKFTA